MDNLANFFVLGNYYFQQNEISQISKVFAVFWNVFVILENHKSKKNLIKIGEYTGFAIKIGYRKIYAYNLGRIA